MFIVLIVVVVLISCAFFEDFVDPAVKSIGESSAQKITPIPKEPYIPPEGFKVYSVPNWVSMGIPENWNLFLSEEIGEIAFTNIDVDYPSRFELTEGTVLVVLYELGEAAQNPIDILETQYQSSLQSGREVVDPPRSITVNGQPAATAKYLLPQRAEKAVEQITVVSTVDRSIAIVFTTLQEDFATFESQFSELLDSLEVGPMASSPSIEISKAGPPSNYLVYENQEVGYWLHYPPDWQFLDQEPGVLFLIPPNVNPELSGDKMIGSVRVIPPEVMQTYEMMAGRDDLGDLFLMLVRVYGWWLFPDIQFVSRPQMTRTGSREILAVRVAATDAGIPITGMVAVVKNDNQSIGFITWMYDVEEYLDDIESVIAAVTLK